MRHATISAWQRHEDGSYAAELNGWNLRVRWRPEAGDQRRGFLWDAEQPSLGTRREDKQVFEEIEIAMAHAEEATEPAGPVASDPAADTGPSHHAH